MAIIWTVVNAGHSLTVTLWREARRAYKGVVPAPVGVVQTRTMAAAAIFSPAARFPR